MAVGNKTNGANGVNGRKMHKPSIFVLDPYHPDAVSMLQRASDVDVVLPNDLRRDDFRKEATVLLLRSETRITAEDFEKCQNLQCIIKQGVGMDNVDLEAAAKAGVSVHNTPGLNSEAVAELSLAMALSLARRVPEVDRRIRAGETVIRSKTLGRSLHRKTLGIIGMGNIGLAFAKKWVGAMEGNIIAYDPYSDGKQWASATPRDQFQRADSLNEVLEVADVVSLHVPLTESTRNAISTEQFARMKPNAILLNAARGGIVDEQALFEALSKGKLFGVGLDAVESEPPTKSKYGHLLEFPNVVITPHIGASTIENQSRSGVVAAEMALEFVRGNDIGNKVV